MSETKVTTMTDPENDKGNMGHNIRIAANQLVKECQDAGIPMFFAYYLPDKGYQYAAMFPEEMPDRENLKSEHNKFKKFLQVIIDFNKEDYMTQLSGEAGAEDASR